MRSCCFLVLASTLLIAPTGCGEPPAPPIPSDGGGRRDAQVDASSPDAGDSGDAGGAADAGDAAIDAGGGFDPGTCHVDPENDVLTLGTDAPARARDVGIAAGATGVAITWSAGPGMLDEIFLAELPDEGALVAGMAVTSLSAVSRDPVIAPSGTGWMLGWYSNADGDFDTYAQAWGADGRAAGDVRRLTMRVGRDDSPALLPTTSGALAAWIEQRTDTARLAVTRPLDLVAAPTAAQRDSSTASNTVSRPVLAHRSGGFALAWVESASATPTVLLQRLDPAGAPVGVPIELSTERNADGTIDLAMNESGGAATFGAAVGGVRPEVRARLLDGSGNPSGPERVITSAPAAGRDASIAALAGGYVIAYRALEGDTPQLRVSFVAADLTPVGTLDVTSVAPTGGRVTIRVTGEGRIALAWADVDETATTIRAARIRCE